MTEQDLQQIPEELRELFALLDEQGWKPQLCDTPVDCIKLPTPK